jgi:ribosomal protein S18 acetylase RimI-like enzyme
VIEMPGNLTIRCFSLADEEAVIALWRQCNLVHPSNDPRKDIRCKLQVQPEMFLVGFVGQNLIASVMAGYEGHRGWINYLAVSPEYRNQGFARSIMTEAERLLRAAGCPKINLQVRTTNGDVIECYHRLGYSVDDVVSLGKRLEHDDQSGQ